MKNSYKLALLATLGLASVTAVQAQSFYNDGTANNSGDLIIGIYQSGVANTAVINLGSFATLANGESWTLNTLGLASAGFGSTLSSTALFGVVGDNGGVFPHAVYATTSGFLPNNVTGGAGYNQVDSYMGLVAIGTQAVNSGSDWFKQSDPAPIDGSLTMAGALGYSPNVLATGGVADLWTINANGSAPTLVGSFTLDPTTEVLTFNVAPVPEPTTFALLGGAGLLLLSFRKKLGRKQA